MVEVVAVITALACSVKFVLLCPDGIVYEGGRGNAVLLVLRPITAPVGGAGPLSVRVTVAFCPAGTVLGLIEMPVKTGALATLTVKYTGVEVGLLPAELEADTLHR
jgi:hypothetical protein